MGERDKDNGREKERERELNFATRRVVVLNKMFAGAISVNSVVLCLLIQPAPSTPPTSHSLVHTHRHSRHEDNYLIHTESREVHVVPMVYLSLVGVVIYFCKSMATP